MSFLTTPQTYRDLITLRTQEINASFAAGESTLFVYPYRSFGPYLVILYVVLLPPSRSKFVYYVRYPIFAFCLYWCALTIAQCKSTSIKMGYGIGLLNAWGCLWISSILIWRDGRGQMRRIERVPVGGSSQSEGNDGNFDGNLDASEAEGDASGVAAAALNGKADGQNARFRHAVGSTSLKGPKSDNSQDDEKSSQNTSTVPYIWQPLPSDLLTRINWSADLLTNFRLTGWSHQISSIPSPPSYVQSSLQDGKTVFLRPSPSKSSTTGNVRYPTRTALLSTKLRIFIRCYLILDAMKVVMMWDPYFWGIAAGITSPAPSYFLPFIATSPVLVRTYRLLLTLLGTYTALQTIFSLGPLFFIGLLPLLLPSKGIYSYKSIMGARAEIWHYPDMYGSYRTVFRKGLAGWWGGWWHQIFRFGFEAPSTWALEKLGWEKRSLKGKALGMMIAFGLSGALHACGSYSLWPQTNPLSGPLAFFTLQPVGIGLQMGLSMLLKTVRVRDRLPGWVRGTGNFVYAHVWFYYVAPLLTDDFARGGIWLMEPVPVSILRGLGLGLEGEGWLQWHWPLVRWHTGERWWQSGLAI
ncbi:MAG: hypothetical protein MMC33_006344 [Icmadophila ericetorum]|nr:hypothetical protein [Icmadophila ericetorum]